MHSKHFKFLHCLGLIDMLIANQNADLKFLYVYYYHPNNLKLRSHVFEWIDFMTTL